MEGRNKNETKCQIYIWGGGYFTNKNVKAFTLIELLAVIVILAIIALIATPIILGIINDAKEKAFKESLNNAKHAYELYVAKEELDPTFDSGKEISIKDLPLDSNLSGKIFKDDEDKITFKNVTDENYCASGTMEDLNMVKGSCEDLLKNILTIKPNANPNAKGIIVTVDVIEGYPTSYTYKIEGPDNYSKTETTTSNTYTFSDLKEDTEYTVVITVKNKSGLPKTETLNVRTKKGIILDLTPKEEYIKEGTVKITYPNIEGAVNKYKWSDEEEFTPVIENSVEVPAKNGTLIAIVQDAEEVVVTQNSITINNIDTTGPTYTTTVDDLKVTITASDPAGLDTKAYSCDGVWQENNVCTFEEYGNHTINVRDALENEGEETTIKLSNIPMPTQGSLTPVVYENNNWKVVSSMTGDWSDYDNQKWGNAVLLKSGVTKNVGDTVTVEGSNPDIQAMFVWIPRYEYKIEGTYGKGGTSTSSPGEIEVKFIGKSKTTADSGYIIHPAFNFGGVEQSGIWVGKFETSHTTLSSSTTANNLGCSNNNCSSADGLRVLPNVESLRRNNVSNFFFAAQSMDNRLNINGDLHMMKNSEWGAAAYLSQSKYGKYGNPSYSGAEKEVAINSNSSYMTGGGNYTSNIAQSTTGNITGIYDMSGGAFEYVMGYYTPASSTWGASSNSNYAGFSSVPDAKYFDAYTSTTATTACSSGVCYGHALSETSGWYGDYTIFVNSGSPWMRRGGSYNTDSNAGVFYFNNHSGYYYSYSSFRVALSQTT